MPDSAPWDRPAANPGLATPRSRRQLRYWRRNVRLTAGLLLIWFVVTFVAGWYAADLNQFELMGFPVGFYTFAQGGPLVFLAIIFTYTRFMNRLDRAYGVAEKP
jgi:putative solute:sodium symporter small subunit